MWLLFYSSKRCLCHSNLMVTQWQISLYLHFFLTEHKGWAILHSCCISHEQEHWNVIKMAKPVSQRIKMHLIELCSAQRGLENQIALWAPNPLWSFPVPLLQAPKWSSCSKGHWAQGKHKRCGLFWCASWCWQVCRLTYMAQLASELDSQDSLHQKAKSEACWEYPFHYVRSTVIWQNCQSRNSSGGNISLISFMPVSNQHLKFMILKNLS